MNDSLGMNTGIQGFRQDLSALDKITFPVAMEPIFTEKPHGSDGQLFSESGYQVIPNYQAVMAQDNGHIFSVVGKNYKLVTNKEALDLAEKCFSAVFETLGANQMTLFNVITPKTRSFCHVDFIHKESKFEMFSNDSWVPYIRVSNSYNRMFALNFDLGFCRWICKNGIIFVKNNIQFKFHHNKSVRNPEVEFNLKRGSLKELEKAFIESTMNLKRYHVPPKYMWPLTCKVFDFKIPSSPSPRQAEAIAKMREHVLELSERYFQQLGENGYAAMNVLTDFATRPVGQVSTESSVNVLQKKTGDWMEQFVTSIEQRDFDFENYLGPLIKLAVK